MFTAKSMLFLCVETPLHAGTGRSLGTVDLPIQRERSTGYPIVQASSIKGRLRAETNPDPKSGSNPDYRLSKDDWLTIFGPGQENKAGEPQASDFGGALSTGDARILLFPVRSLAGVFAWVTCVDVLARFQREAVAVGILDANDKDFVIPKSPDKNTALVVGDKLIAGDSVVLEEFSFKPEASNDEKGKLSKLADWLSKHALPQKPTKKDGEPEPIDAYDYWRKNLVNKICLLHDDAFRDFVLYGTEVQTHIALDPATKTVKSGALWTAESLPVDSVLYAPVQSTPPRNPQKPSTLQDGSAILKTITDLKLDRIHLGGDETTGQGIVALRFEGGA